MTDSVIPEDVRHFIIERIDSIAQMEALLLLCVRPRVEMSVQDIAQRLYINEGLAISLLTHLVKQGLLVVTEGAPFLYKYQPATPELERLITRITDTYRQYLVPVTHLIHSKPKTRIQEFADAFWLRKD